MSSTALACQHTAPPAETAANHVENARRKSSEALEFTVEALAKRVAAEGNLTQAQLLSYAEFFYKASGAAAKNAQQAQPQGTGFSIVINIPGADGGQTLTIGPSNQPEEAGSIFEGEVVPEKIQEGLRAADRLFQVEDFIGDFDDE